MTALCRIEAEALARQPLDPAPAAGTYPYLELLTVEELYRDGVSLAPDRGPSVIASA